MIWEWFFFFFWIWLVTFRLKVYLIWKLYLNLNPKPFEAVTTCSFLLISTRFGWIFIGSLTFKTCLWVCAIWFPCNWNKHFDLMYTIWFKIIKNHHQSFQLFVEIWWFWINCKYLVNFQFVFFSLLWFHLVIFETKIFRSISCNKLIRILKL